MAQNRKYENLPDLDRDAPDIYETPDLTEDTTLPSSTARSASQTSSYTDDSDDGISGVDRRRLQPDEARTHFQPSRVDAKGVDFSDRIRRHRQSYRTASRRQRQGSRGTDNEYGDFSDEEDETLERKLARLRREVEEIKQEYELREKEREAEAGENSADEEEDENPTEGIAKLGEMLDAVYVQRQGGVRGAEAQFTRTLKRFSRTDDAATGVAADTTSIPETRLVTTTSSQQAAQALAKAADFDSRLEQIEKALGLNATNMPDLATHPPKSILHNLDTLERQLTSITDVSTNSLDSASRRVQKLTQEVEHLEELRKAARAAQDSVTSPVSRERSGTLSATGDLPELMGAYIEDPERVAKINALYGTLATIESLSPTLPLVLERLRTLRLIHTSAGTASAMLDELDKRQGEQAEEIRLWREALTKVEENLKGGESTLSGNIKTVGDWVRDLEARIARFS